MTTPDTAGKTCPDCDGETECARSTFGAAVPCPTCTPNPQPEGSDELRALALAVAEAAQAVQRTSGLPALTDKEARLTFRLGRLVGYFHRTGELPL